MNTRVHWLIVCLAACATLRAPGQQVPLDGFFPLVGIGLTDEFDENFNFFPSPEDGVSGNLLGPNGTGHYDLALLDTGAGFSVLSDAGFDAFNLDGPYPGEPDGYNGTEGVTIGGATGQLFAPINDPFGLYVGGLQDRTGAGVSLTMNDALLQGQTNTSTITLPPESDLPNIVGLPFASQYATRIRGDDPQVFQLGGKTIRSPAIDFLPLGSGGGDIVRKAPLNLNPGATFAQPPAYLLNIIDFDIDKPQENPSTPTLMQGGLFLNVQANNNGGDLGGTTEFFFDTGASVTVVSQLNALNLGFDVLTDEPEFTISIVGSGGVLSDVPGFVVDEFTIVALGGSVTATNVPVIVLDVADPSDPGNVVEGIVGTNLLSGRNVVIDPNPSLGGGGESAGVYISDPLTNDFNWSASAASSGWSDGPSWDAGVRPDLLSVADIRPTGGQDQRAIVTGAEEAWSATIAGGDGGERMSVVITRLSSLTTFSGVSIQDGGAIELDDGVLDAQYVDIRGGRLEGKGDIRTGSGPIVGQVEIVSGVLVANGPISIEGRLVMGEAGSLELDLSQGGQIAATDTAGVNGGLIVTLDAAPVRGQTFDLITSSGLGGVFDTLDLPSAYDWTVLYGATTLSITADALPGDFNDDGVVDAADYSVWRDGLGTQFDAADYDVWASNYGASFAIPRRAVPEPSALAAGMVAIAASVGARRRDRCSGS